MIALVTGLLAGTIHVISGPDHMVAIAPLSTTRSARTGMLGALWGLGHGGGLAAWLLLASALRGLLDLERISAFAEALVGVVLIALGCRVLRPLLSRRVTAPPHATERGKHAALGMGILHGTAGAGHLALVLPTLGLSLADAAAYVLGYVLAGVLAMVGVSHVLGSLARRTGHVDALRAGSGVCALGVGAAWLVMAAWAVG